MQNDFLKNFSEEEHGTWRLLYARLGRSRRDQATPLFSRGLRLLGIGADEIPDLDEVNQHLFHRTGWKGIPVPGFVPPQEFFRGLARREFPVGHFIRDREVLDYTPEPDVFHDLYGHLPLLADPEYAEFCRRFGVLASRYTRDEQIRALDRLFWYGVEFPLVKTADGLKIFGGGILSSRKECDHALGGPVSRKPFAVAEIMETDFQIDRLQATLFVLRSPAQLYSCLDEAASYLDQLSPIEVRSYEHRI